MQIQIRENDRNEGQSLQEYRAAQARAWMQRNQKQLRDQFWARKERDRIEGEARLIALGYEL